MNHSAEKSGLPSDGLGASPRFFQMKPLLIPSREALRAFGEAFEAGMMERHPAFFARASQGVYHLVSRLIVLRLPYVPGLSQLIETATCEFGELGLRTQAWHAMPQGDGGEAQGDGLYLGRWFTISHYPASAEGGESLFIRWTEIEPSI